MNRLKMMLATRRDSLIITASVIDMAGDFFQYIFLKTLILPFPFNLIQNLICHHRILDFAFQLYSPLAGIYRMLKIMRKQRLSAWTCLDQTWKDDSFFMRMKMWISDLIACRDELLQSCRIRLRFLNLYPESDCGSQQWCLS